MVRIVFNSLLYRLEKVITFAAPSEGRVKKHRGVEQLVARRAHNPKVVGSSPAPATKKALKKFNAFIF